MKTKFKIFNDFCMAVPPLGTFFAAFAWGLMTVFLWILVSLGGLTEDGNMTFLVSAVWGALPVAAVSAGAYELRSAGSRTPAQLFFVYGLPAMAVLCILLSACSETFLPYRALQLILTLPAFLLGMVPAQAALFCSQFAASLNLSADCAELVYGLTGGLFVATWSCFLMWCTGQGPALTRFIRSRLHGQAEMEVGSEALVTDSLCEGAPSDSSKEAE